MTNGQHKSQPLTSILAFLCLFIAVHCSKENLPLHNTKVGNNIQKREADTSSDEAGLDYSTFHEEPVKRSASGINIDDLLLTDSPDKRGRGGNRYGFYGALGKRNDPEDMEKRRMRKMFYGSLGKRMPSFFAGLGKRDGGSYEEDALEDELDKRGRANKYFFGSLGKRDLEEEDEDEDDVEKRRMHFFGSLGKRGRNKGFRFYGNLGKRDGTSIEDMTDFDGSDDMEKRRFKQFFGTLGKREDDLDLEKRRRFAFASLGKRLNDDNEENDDMEKRRMKMRPAFYGSLGKRRQMFFGTLGKRSVSSPDDELFDDQTEDVHSRRKRSLSSLNLSRSLRNRSSYGRARRYNRIALGRRLIRRTQNFRFFPQLGKRSFETYQGVRKAGTAIRRTQNQGEGDAGNVPSRTKNQRDGEAGNVPSRTKNQRDGEAGNVPSRTKNQRYGEAGNAIRRTQNQGEGEAGNVLNQTQNLYLELRIMQV
ncbi:uncharacterized protein LOC132554146 [Ylistrum balloti]|uniref:uncharacterized protein LOC132554146 n=1 Tax=Ylistrum balloti TaxID=509963 RepID=UPI0029059497|nr:uncharacterized protein LOC132554146 [Ylistrum balloti]